MRLRILIRRGSNYPRVWKVADLFMWMIADRSKVAEVLTNLLSTNTPLLSINKHEKKLDYRGRGSHPKTPTRRMNERLGPTIISNSPHRKKDRMTVADTSSTPHHTSHR